MSKILARFGGPRDQHRVLAACRQRGRDQIAQVVFAAPRIGIALALDVRRHGVQHAGQRRERQKRRAHGADHCPRLARIPCKQNRRGPGTGSVPGASARQGAAASRGSGAS